MPATQTPATSRNAADLADVEVLIERQTSLLADLFIARTDSDGAMAFWSMQVGVLDDLVAFKLDLNRKIARARFSRSNLDVSRTRI